MSPKKCPLPRKQNFWGGDPNGKVVVPGVVVICLIAKNCDHYTKNWLLAPNIQILGSKKHIFAPSGQLEPHRSMFSTQKRCLIGIPIRGYPNFYSLPPKNWILGPKTAKFGPILAFSANYGHFWSKKLLEIDQFEVTMFLRGKSDLSFFLSLHNLYQKHESLVNWRLKCKEQQTLPDYKNRPNTKEPSQPGMADAVVPSPSLSEPLTISQGQDGIVSISQVGPFDHSFLPCLRK